VSWRASGPVGGTGAAGEVGHPREHDMLVLDRAGVDVAAGAGFAAVLMKAQPW
jgi:hypothetical protein